MQLDQTCLGSVCGFRCGCPDRRPSRLGSPLTCGIKSISTGKS